MGYSDYYDDIQIIVISISCVVQTVAVGSK